MSSIRHISAPIEGTDLFATAEFERTVSVWSFQEKRLISKFDTPLDFGGRRLLAALGDRPVIAAGAYTGEVCAFDARTGGRLWHREGLIGLQCLCAVHVSENRRLIGAGFDSGPFRLIGIESGEAISELPGVMGLCSNEAGATVRHMSGQIAYSDAAERVTWRHAVAKPILATAIGSGSLLVSEMGGPLSNFDFNGGILWRWQPDAGHHVLSVCWHSNSSAWYAVCVCYVAARPHRLVSLTENGEVVSARDIDTIEHRVCETQFFSGGEYLITSGGQVLELPDLWPAWNFSVE